MGHQHTYSHDSTSNIKVAFFLNLSFTILEIIGGLWTNSIAIVADALHDLGDSFSLGLAWYLDRYAKKGRDRKYSYGYRRFSLLGALANTIVLIAGGLFVLSEAVPRIIRPEPANAAGMVIFAIAGIVINGLAVLRVRGGKSLNVQIVTWHLLEDVLGWVAVLVVSIILLFRDIFILDAVLSILITLYVLYNVVGNLRKTVALFLQAVPEEIDIGDIETKLLAIDKVQSTHHTHVWSLDGEHHVLTTHVVVNDRSTKEDILQVKGAVIALVENMDCEHVTIDIEYENEDCRMKEHE
jgi:cobalt-zinc-cadmium efflux system protein